MTVTAYLAEALVHDYFEPRDCLCVVGFSGLPHVRVRVQEKVTAARR